MRSLFFGGVHPDGHKALSASSVPAAMPLPAQVAILLRQHIGTPCKPLVSVGDTVHMGQKIGDGEGLCVPVHASVAGVVEAIEDRPHPGGGLCPAIIIKNDFLDTPDPSMKPQADPELPRHRARDSPTPRPRPVQRTEKPAFTLPIPNQDYRRVFAYLQKRGIASQVILGFIKFGFLRSHERQDRSVWLPIYCFINEKNVEGHGKIDVPCPSETQRFPFLLTYALFSSLKPFV